MLAVECVMESYSDYVVALESFKSLFEESLSSSPYLWATHDTDIRLPDSTIQVRNGAARVWLQHAPSDLAILDVEPLALGRGEQVWLHICGLTAEEPFKVLCRHHGCYHSLDVQSFERKEDGTAMISLE